MPRGSKEFNDRDHDLKAESSAIEQKSGDASTVIESVDEDRGIVEAIVSVTGLRDSVDDVIEPGAYEKTLKRRTPKGVWSHQWSSPVSKTLDIKEVMPGDPSLPDKLGNGDPWPAEAGALVVKTQFNLDSPRGQQAFSDVKFFGGDGAWSIGYKASRATRDSKTGVRHIKELDLFEYSPVLHGANAHAKTLSVKSLDDAKAALAEGGYDVSSLDDLVESKDARQDEAFDGLAASEVKDLIAARDLLDAYLDELGVQSKRTVVEGDPDLEEPAERWVDSSQDDGPMSLYGELEQLLDPDDFAELLDLAAEFDDASDEGDDDAAGEIMSEFLDVFEAEEENDEALSALRDVVADVIDDRYPELAEDDDAYYDDDESDEDEESEDDDGEYDDAEDADDSEAEDAEPEADVEASGEKSAYWVKEIPKAKRDEMASSGSALKDGTYPIANARQLQSAIRLRTQGNAPNKVVDDHIKKRANSLNLSHMLPDSMRSGSSSSGDGGKKKPPFGKGGEKSLAPMSWGSDEASNLVLSTIDWNN